MARFCFKKFWSNVPTKKLLTDVIDAIIMDHFEFFFSDVFHHAQFIKGATDGSIHSFHQHFVANLL